MSKKRIHLDTLHGILASCLIFFPILNFRRSAGNAGPVSKKKIDTPNFRHYPDTFGEKLQILDAFRHSLLSSRGRRRAGAAASTRRRRRDAVATPCRFP